MADNSANVAKMARVFAIVHIIVGFLLICFGIADGVVQYFWTGYIWFGVWTGVWVSFVCGMPNIYPFIFFCVWASSPYQLEVRFIFNFHLSSFNSWSKYSAKSHSWVVFKVVSLIWTLLKLIQCKKKMAQLKINGFSLTKLELISIKEIVTLSELQMYFSAVEVLFWLLRSFYSDK